MPTKDEPVKSKRKYPWWLETLAAIGAAAIVAVIVTLFFAVGRRPGRLVPTQAPAVDAPEFIAAVAGTAGTPVRKGGTVHLLNNGVEIFPALLQALRAARHTITFSVYIWEPGQVSDQVSAALISGTTGAPSSSTGRSDSRVARRWRTSGWAPPTARSTGGTRW